MSATIRFPVAMKVPRVVWVISHRRRGEKWMFWGWRESHLEAIKAANDLRTAGWYGARCRRTLVKPAVSQKELDRRQATRRRTLYPLPPQAVFERRADVAQGLKRAGLSFYAIRQVLKCSGPEEARRLCARRLKMVNAEHLTFNAEH